MKNSNTKINIINYSIIFFWIIFYFFDLLNSGFFGDDSWNSQIRGNLIEENISLLQRIDNEWKGWLFNNGSIRIAYYFIIYPLFYYVENIIYYKLITIGFLFFSCLFFYILITEITNDKKKSLAVTMLLPIFFQFRDWNDPILGFPSFMMPFTLTIILISIIFFIKYLRTNNSKYNFYSVLIFLINPIMYEISIPFLAIYPLIAKIKFNDTYKCICIAKYHLALLFIILFFILFINKIYIPLILNGEIAYGAVQFHFSSLTKLFQAFIIQISASIPSIYFWTNFDELNKISVSIIDLLIVFSFGLIFVKNLFYKKNLKIKNNNNIIIRNLGLFFLIVPALLAALSGHQGDIRYLGIGNGYIPVYIQYFGAAFLVAYTLNFKYNNKLKLLFSYLSFFIFLILSILNLNSNKNILENLNQKYFYPSKIVNTSIRAGLFNDLKENDVIIREMKIPADYSRNYISQSKKLLYTCDYIANNKFPIDISCIKRKKDNNVIWGMKYFYTTDFSKTYVVLFKINVSHGVNLSTNYLKLYEYHSNQISNFKMKNNINVRKIFESSTNKPNHILNLINENKL